MGDDWVPSPDVAVMRGSFDRLKNDLLKAGDVAILLEVAHKTYSRDLAGSCPAMLISGPMSTGSRMLRPDHRGVYKPGRSRRSGDVRRDATHVSRGRGHPGRAGRFRGRPPRRHRDLFMTCRASGGRFAPDGCQKSSAKSFSSRVSSSCTSFKRESFGSTRRIASKQRQASTASDARRRSSPSRR